MQTSSLTFKTIQSLLSTAIIAGGIASCNTNIENRSMNQEKEKKRKEAEIKEANRIEKAISDKRLNDEYLERLLPVNGPLMEHIRANITRHIIKLKFRSQNCTSKSILCIIHYEFNSLQFIDLNKNYIGDRGCKHLSMLKAPNLCMINLYSCDISSTGIDHLSKTEWNNLECLELGRNYFNNEGIKSISRGRYKLKMLNLIGNNYILDFHPILLALLTVNNSDLELLTFDMPYDMTYTNEMKYVECIKNKFPEIDEELF